MPFNAALTTDEMVPITITPLTKGGAPAPIDGDPVVTVLSGDGSVRPGPDASRPFLASGDQPGDTVFLVEIDADLGEGVVTVSDTVTLTATSASAASVGISVGPAVPKS